MTRTLGELLAALPMPWALEGSAEARITAPIAESDADVQPGGLFVARGGLSTDGHRFIPRAIARGAAAVLGEQPLQLSVPYVRVENAAEALGWLAAAWHGFPSRRLTVYGVTGTDGKTSTSTLLHSILNLHSGGTAGLLSTISAQIGGDQLDTGLHVTTPGAPQVQAILAQMADRGLTSAVIEMTSHGLAQGRLNGIDLDVAMITNLTHEHLDYHGSFENYRAAKGRMFAMLGASARKPRQPKLSIVNGDDANADFYAAFPADRHIRCGLGPASDYRAVDIVHQPGHTQFMLHISGQPAGVITLALAGRFNVMNALMALTAAHAQGIPLETIERGLLAVTGISGRLERLDEGQPFLALVDFAHTPNALENALRASRDMLGPGGRVIVVFGCAGLRDREKRQLMPAVAQRLADFTLMTAEDPRTESLDDILDGMAAAAVQAGGVEGRSFWRVPDRGQALARAVALAQPGDVVIACGKGHEQSMCFGTVEYAWDDRQALRAALRGQPLTTLPTAHTG